ncbi:MAG: thioredoxin domain-containing protein [Pyrinomonadaceae bacterium]
MKFITAIFCLLIFALSGFAQKTDEVLATSAGKTFTAVNLDEQTQKAWLNRRKIIADARVELFAGQVSDILLATEAAARKTTVKKLLEAETTAKVADPSTAQIQAIYEANKDRLENKPLAEVRPQIVSYLRREPEQKAAETFIAALKIKHKTVFGKDVNSPNLNPSDVLATVGLKQITFRDFEEENKFSLYELDAKIYDAVERSLEEAILAELVSAEAARENLSSGEIIAREITDKLKDYSDKERFALQTAFKDRLFAKYDVKVLIAEPKPVAQNISTDDDPSQGDLNAPVTVVMFSDFQCSACSAVHPILKKAMAAYKDKIHFVVRDFPLELIHANAFQAAQAANAANAQGKFFEYTELLYNNQNSLDNASLKEFASKIALDRKKFDADLDSGKFAGEIRKDIADGISYRINSTPTIFVNGVMVRQFSEEGFKKAIERALKK